MIMTATVDKSSFNRKTRNIRGGYKTQTGLQVVTGSKLWYNNKITCAIPGIHIFVEFWLYLEVANVVISQVLNGTFPDFLLAVYKEI